MQKSKVYITRIPARMDDNVWVPTFDISPAKEFGELEIILPMGLNFINTEQYQPRMATCLGNFKMETDYLLALSDPSLIVVAGALLGSRLPWFNILVWDRNLKRYFPHKVRTV